MLRLVKHEIAYAGGSLLAWLTVLLVAAGWPLLSGIGADSIPTSLAFMAVSLPLCATVTVAMQLMNEQSENRGKLFRLLPLSGHTVAIARQVRSLMMPAAALIMALLLLAIAFAVDGAGLLQALDGAWVLPSFFFGACALALLVLSLYDLGGLNFSLVTVIGLAVAGFMLASNVPAFSDLLMVIDQLGQTPWLPLILLVLCVVLMLGDARVVRWKQARY